MGLSGLAITDHEVLASHVEASQIQQKMIKDGMDPSEFKVVLGDEIYLVPDIQEMRKNYSTCGHSYYHFIVLAKDLEGYQLLKEISSTAWENSYSQRGMERVPIDYNQISKIIAKNPGHLIGSTACLGGQVAKLIVKLSEAEKEFGELSQEAYKIKSDINDFLTFCIKIFGIEDFYLEVQPSFTEEQILVNTRIKSLAKFYGIKMIFTTDTHFLKESDRTIHKAYLNSKNGEREVDAFYATAYMMDEEEVWYYLKDTFTREEFKEMVENTIGIADKCEAYDLGRKQVIPQIPVKEKLKNLKLKYKDAFVKKTDLSRFPYIKNMLGSKDEQDAFWIYSCIEGMFNKIIGKPVANPIGTYWARVNEEAKELWEISKTIDDRMTKYYNTMQFIIELVWDKGNSLVGPARGSATGFLTCYLQNITQIDPIVWNLPHWRLAK